MSDLWDRVEYPLFTLHTDEDGVGRITVDRFPEVIVVDGKLLDQVDPAVVRRELASNTITFHIANGDATYRIVAFERDNYLCERVDGRVKSD